MTEIHPLLGILSSFILSYISYQLEKYCCDSHNTDYDYHHERLQQFTQNQHYNNPKKMIVKRIKLEKQPCSICLELMTEQDTLVIINNCFHIYHNTCYDKVLKYSNYQCVICRS